MISRLLRWSAGILLVLLVLVVTALIGFRLAASFRETGTREALAPATGRLVQTASSGVFIQEKGPDDGIPVVLFHGTAAWSELWWRTSEALATAGFRVIALDLPPFGFSDRARLIPAPTRRRASMTCSARSGLSLRSSSAIPSARAPQPNS